MSAMDIKNYRVFPFQGKSMKFVAVMFAIITMSMNFVIFQVQVRELKLAIMQKSIRMTFFLGRTNFRKYTITCLRV